MAARIDLFDSTYAHFTDHVLAAVRQETFGRDIGQNSWLTADEFERFIDWLNLAPEQQALEVASGSGGPALHLAKRARCRVTGIDSNPLGVVTAAQAAIRANLSSRATFAFADANATLPFESNS